MTRSIEAGRSVLRLSFAVLLVATVAVLLVAAQLRFFVPDRKPARVRDLSWASQPGR